MPWVQFSKPDDLIDRAERRAQLNVAGVFLLDTTTTRFLRPAIGGSVGSGRSSNFALLKVLQTFETLRC